MRAVQTFITFKNAFTLPGIPGLQQPGTYGTVTLEEKIQGINFVGWNSVSTSFRMPAIGDSGSQHYVAVCPDRLHHALVRDSALPQSAVDI
jgi:hypothetical protein